MPERDQDIDEAAREGGPEMTGPERDAMAGPGTAAPTRLELGESTSWHRVSPTYLLVEIVGTVIGGLVFCAAAAALWFLTAQPWSLWVLGAIAAIFLISLAFEPRRVRSIGYQLRADDLLFRRGIMFQRFVSVPYGRMQLVDITRSPIARALGLAELKFVTAAAGTGVVIPGLPLEEAEQLRDRLVALAESRRAGL